MMDNELTADQMSVSQLKRLITEWFYRTKVENPMPDSDQTFVEMCVDKDVLKGDFAFSVGDVPYISDISDEEKRAEVEKWFEGFLDYIWRSEIRTRVPMSMATFLPPLFEALDDEMAEFASAEGRTEEEFNEFFIEKATDILDTAKSFINDDDEENFIEANRVIVDTLAESYTQEQMYELTAKFRDLWMEKFFPNLIDEWGEWS